MGSKSSKKKEKKAAAAAKTEEKPKPKESKPVEKKEAPKKASEAPKTESAPPTAPGDPQFTSKKCKFDKKKLMIEGATKEDGVIEVTITNKAHSVYIYKAQEATIVINGKCNSIAIDGCKKAKVLCDTVVGIIEVGNSQRMQVQIREFAPTISIDKTDGCLCYLSKACVENKDFNIAAAKSSEMNISFPYGPDDEYVEKPLPEQFVYKVKTDPKGSSSIEANVSDLYST